MITYNMPGILRPHRPTPHATAALASIADARGAGFFTVAS